MKYRDILGFTKSKKKIIKERSKPKKNKIIEGIKQELNEWSYQPPTEKRWSKSYDKGLTEFEETGGKDIIKEVGAGVQYKKFYKDIERQQQGLSKSVGKFKKYLEKQGLKSQARELEDNYLIDSYGWMRKWLKQFISKLM